MIRWKERLSRFSVTGHVDNLLMSCAHRTQADCLQDNDCFVNSAASRPADQCTACHLSSNSGRQAVLRFTSLVGVRQCRRQGQIGGVPPSFCKARISCGICSDPRKHLRRGWLQAVLESYIQWTTSTPPSPASPRDDHYSLRNRTNHNLQLPLRTSALNDRNFFMNELSKVRNYSKANSK